MAENAANYLQQSSANLAQSVAELSSGSKIVNPSDDPAGLAVSMAYTAESSELGAASQNVANALSYSQTQDGFLQQVGTALDRMATLATQSQDTTETDTDRSAYNAEFTQLQAYITDVGKKDFNGVSMFAGVTNAVSIDAGGDTWSMAGVALSGASAAGLIYTAATTQADSSVSTTTQAATALTNVTAALNQLALDRGNVGANETRLNYTSNQLSVEKTNVDAANSAIMDVDVAQESTNYSKLQILVQSGTAMLAQANSIPQTVLKLIGG